MAINSRRPEHLNHFRRPDTLEDAGAVVIDTRGCVRLTVITGAGATATLSRVDSSTADAHTATTITVAADTIEVTEVDWPFYRLSVAGGDCRVAVV